MKKVFFGGFAVALLLGIGILSTALSPLRAASQNIPSTAVAQQETASICVQAFLDQLQMCLSVTGTEGVSCILNSVQTLLTCLGDDGGNGGGNGGGEVITVLATNNLQFVLPNGSNNAEFPLVINVGDTVRWMSTGLPPHTVTSGPGSNDPSAGALFDQLLPAGATFEFTFTASGTFPYFCRPHENVDMRGTVVVNP